MIPSSKSGELDRRTMMKVGCAAALGATFGHKPALVAEDDDRDDLVYLSASRLAKKIRRKKVTSEEVVTAYIQQIKTKDPEVNAVVYLAEEEALAAAKQADRAIARDAVDWSRQPLFGVPVSFKDSYETKGIPTTAGAPLLKYNVPDEDATVVRKMKEAGAIVLAKTNMPLLGLAFDTNNLVHGQTNNPYDRSRIPGGSSGGEAALVAYGGSALGIGGDGSGSIRVPSHFCGVAGFCPSWGRVSAAGVVPLCQNSGPFFLANGPIARHVDDLGLALSIIEGCDYRDPFTFPLAPTEGKSAKSKGLRIAYFTDTSDVTPTESTRLTVKKAAQALMDCGNHVEERRPPFYDMEHPVHLEFALVVDNVLIQTPKLQKEYGAEEDSLLNDLVDLFRERIKEVPKDELKRLPGLLPVLQRDLLAFMQDYDALLCPACSHPAMKHGTIWDHACEGAVVFTELFSLVGSLPKGVVRCGVSPEGLPIGVQVVGAPWRDDVVLGLLAQLEKVFGGWQPPGQ